MKSKKKKKKKRSADQNGSHFENFWVVSRFLYSGGWQVCECHIAAKYNNSNMLEAKWTPVLHCNLLGT